MQHDAAVNPGSSGDALVDKEGRLIGMNSRIADGSRYYVGFSYAISVDDPAIDLGVMAAVLSSNADIPLDKGVCFAAEIGLAGEVRPVRRVDQRILEAEKLGFSQIYVSKNNKIGLKKHSIEIIKVAKIEDVISKLFG